MLDHGSSTPLYAQLVIALEQAIHNGEYCDGEKLPSENEFCRKYNISRITVRQALNILEKKNLIYTVHGKGTFVKIPLISQGLLKVISFSKTLQQKGLEGHTKVHSFSASVKSRTAKEVLNCAEYGDICNLDLIGFAHQTPIVYYHSFIRSEIGQKMHCCALELEKKAAAFSTYDLYSELGIRLEKIDQTIMAIGTDKRIGKLLGLTEGSALLVLESMVYGDGGIPLEYKTGYYRPDKYAFNVKREVD